MLRRKFLAMAVGMYAGIAMGLSACGAAVMTWISLGLSLIGTLAPTIPGIIQGFASLVGKTLTAAQLAKLQSIFNGITDLLTQIRTAITNFEANPVGTVLTEIRTLLTTLQNSLNLTNILNDLGISDTGTVAKLTGIINTIFGLATTILSVLPTISVDAAGTAIITAQPIPKNIAKNLQPVAFAQSLNHALWTPCGNKDVDAAFESITAVPVTIKK